MRGCLGEVRGARGSNNVLDSSGSLCVCVCVHVCVCGVQCVCACVCVELRCCKL